MECEEYNRKNVKPYDKIFSIPNNREYYVSAVDKHGVYTNTKEGYSFPYTPRLDFKDFKIVV